MGNEGKYEVSHWSYPNERLGFEVACFISCSSIWPVGAEEASLPPAGSPELSLAPPTGPSSGTSHWRADPEPPLASPARAATSHRPPANRSALPRRPLEPPLVQPCDRHWGHLYCAGLLVAAPNSSMRICNRSLWNDWDLSYTRATLNLNLTCGHPHHQAFQKEGYMQASNFQLRSSGSPWLEPWLASAGFRVATHSGYFSGELGALWLFRCFCVLWTHWDSYAILILLTWYCRGARTIQVEM